MYVDPESNNHPSCKAARDLLRTSHRPQNTDSRPYGLDSRAELCCAGGFKRSESDYEDLFDYGHQEHWL